MDDALDPNNACQLLQAAMDALSLPVLLHDDDHILYANAAAAGLLGAATGKDLTGMALDTFLVPELASTTKERRMYLMCHHMTFADLPIKMRTLDGREIRLTIDARPIEFGDQTIAMVTVAT